MMFAVSYFFKFLAGQRQKSNVSSKLVECKTEPDICVPAANLNSIIPFKDSGLAGI